MSEYAQVPIGELMEARSGRPKFIRAYMEAHSGEWPVYSASLTRPFGFVDDFEYEGPHLTWVMNGYGGRVQEVAGKFSANRDRGVFVPRDGVQIPDLTYMRFAMEPQLVAAAVGRRVDGRLNEYTKIYPGTAEEVLIPLHKDPAGCYDYDNMTEVGEKLRRIEHAQGGVKSARITLERATLLMEVEAPAITLSLGDERYFVLSIGERVLRKDHTPRGVPVYSANPLVPFGCITESNLTDFSKPSLLWGIDGIFDWNLIPAGIEFATTDHCGRLQIVDKRLDPEYVFAYLKFTRSRCGFDRVFRASLGNMRADAKVVVPLDAAGEPSMERQQALSREFRGQGDAQAQALAALDDVLKARMTVEA